MQRKWLWGGVLLGALSFGMLLCPPESQAQRRGFGGYGWGGGWGYPASSGGYGWGGYGMGYGNGWGLSSPYYGTYTYPNYNYSYPGAVNYNWNTPNYAQNTTSSYQAFYPSQDNAAHVTVRLPDPNAQLWFNGTEMPERGPTREFNTPPLNASSENLHYTVRAKWMQGNQAVERTRTVRVQPGQHVMVDFTQQQQTGENAVIPAPADTRPAGNTGAGAVNPAPNQRNPQPGTIPNPDPRNPQPGTTTPNPNQRNPQSGTTPNPNRQP
jgi:uncharacterized protein (TIGR03000 family)